jgi:acetylornithine deacetylase
MRVHGIDERVSLRPVVESAQVLGRLVRDWCGLVPGRKEES